MTPEREQELIEIAGYNLNEAIFEVLNEYGWWDGLIEEDDITDEEYEWIRTNISINLEVSKK